MYYRFKNRAISLKMHACSTQPTDMKCSEFTFSKVPELVLRSLGNATSKKLMIIGKKVIK